MWDDFVSIPHHKECHCMSRIRKLDGEAFDNAGRKLRFSPHRYVISDEYLNGKGAYPVYRVFEYRNVYGALQEEKCWCYDMFQWDKSLSRNVIGTIRKNIVSHTNKENRKLCKCGKELVKQIKALEDYPLYSNYCRTERIMKPKRFYYRIGGQFYSSSCQCNQDGPNVFFKVETSESEPEESDSEED